MRTIQLFICLAVSLSVTTANTFAKEPAKTNPYKEMLSTSKPLDLPTQCAGLVIKAPQAAKELTTVLVVDAVVATHPAVTAAVVAEISKLVPDMAPIAAARGAMLQPKQVGPISKAAAAAAPKQAWRIVYSVCKGLPTSYKTVATSVASAVPHSSSEILGAVTLAIPTLKPYILEAAQQSGNQPTTLSDLINKADKLTPEKEKPVELELANNTADFRPEFIPAPPPTPGPPFKVFPDTITETSPADSGIVQEGARNYAQPTE